MGACRQPHPSLPIVRCQQVSGHEGLHAARNYLWPTPTRPTPEPELVPFVPAPFVPTQLSLAELSVVDYLLMEASGWGGSSLYRDLAAKVKQMIREEASRVLKGE